MEEWVDHGLEGIEAYYLGYSPALVRDLLEKARAFNLLVTGGSDFHGPGSGRERIGGVDVSDELFEALKERL